METHEMLELLEQYFGSQQRIADLLGVTKVQISRWKTQPDQYGMRDATARNIESLFFPLFHWEERTVGELMVFERRGLSLYWTPGFPAPYWTTRPRYRWDVEAASIAEFWEAATVDPSLPASHEEIREQTEQRIGLWIMYPFTEEREQEIFRDAVCERHYACV